MRKPITLILIFLLAVFFTACSDKSPPPPNTESSSAAVSETEKAEKKETLSVPATTTEENEPKTTAYNEIEIVVTEETTAEQNLSAVNEPKSPPMETTRSEKAEITTPPPETETSAPPVVIADSSEVEQKVAEYINAYRSTKATVLSGLTQVARYRSQELVSNFAHTDGTTACNALKYGEYVDMTLYGMSEADSYYQGYNREAIAKGNWIGSADEIGKRIADGFYNSLNHLKYLGSAEYQYMAVGCTYNAATNTWYCCICVSSTDYGG